MARSDVGHFGLLNRYPVQMQANSWHFNQVTGNNAPLTCPDPAPKSPATVWVQSERDAIANALYDAGQMVGDALGFYPRPTYVVNERVYLGQGYPYELQPLHLRCGYIQEFGARLTTLVSAGVAIVYSDADNDGIDDTATITVATTVTDSTQIQLFFQVTDGAESAAHEYWQIEPLTSVTISGGNAVIVAPRYLFVKPSVWAAPYQQPNYTIVNAVDSALAGNFVTAVDVYQVTSSVTATPQLVSDPINCASCGTALSGDTTSASLGRILDSRLSLVQIRASACCMGCGFWPETVNVSYKAGYPLTNGKMDRNLEKAMCRLANTLMPYQPHSFCNTQLNMWQSDNAMYDPNELTSQDSHPFGGLKRGRVEVWQSIRHLQLGRGGKITEKAVYGIS